MATSPTGQRPANVTENPRLYYCLWIAGVAIIVVLLLVSWVAWDKELYKDFGITFNGGSTFALLAVTYLALSLKGVGANEVAGAFFYGKALVRLNSGLHFVPFILMQVKKESRTIQEFQCPGEPEKVFKGDDKEALPDGMIRPIRVVTRAPDPNSKSEEILDTQMSFVVSFVFQYAVYDVFDYIANFGTLETVHIQLRDIGEATVAEYATEKTASKFIEGVPETNQKLGVKVQERFQNSGVKIISARLVSPDITHDVSSALAGIPIARATAKQTKIKADGEEVRLTKEGAGKAAAELSWLSAQAEGLKKIRTELEISGETVLAAEAVRGLSDKTDVIVVGAEGGMKDVMGLVKGAQSALNAGKGGKS